MKIQNTCTYPILWYRTVIFLHNFVQNIETDDEQRSTYKIQGWMMNTITVKMATTTGTDTMYMPYFIGSALTGLKWNMDDLQLHKKTELVHNCWLPGTKAGTKINILKCE